MLLFRGIFRIRLWLYVCHHFCALPALHLHIWYSVICVVTNRTRTLFLYFMMTLKLKKKFILKYVKVAYRHWLFLPFRVPWESKTICSTGHQSRVIQGEGLSLSHLCWKMDRGGEVRAMPLLSSVVFSVARHISIQVGVLLLLVH